MMIKKRMASFLALMIGFITVFSGCRQYEKAPESAMSKINESIDIPEYDGKEKTCYEVFLYSFYDSNGDGVGDFKGLTEKLSYINDGDNEKGNDLSCDEIWLMPICPSPSYHKYDVTDYMSIDPEYGTMDDFLEFLDTAHKNNISVITDLVINHTSSEHEWFLEASDYVKSLKDGEDIDENDCKYVSYYNFSKEKKEGYEPLSGSDYYYEARFYSGMPDLNLDNLDVRNEIKEIISFWLDKGVDGFRLDAVTSYYTGDDNKNIEFLSFINDTVKEKNPDAYIVGECWAGKTVYEKYYESGVDSFFDFSLADSDGLIANTVRGTRKASSFGEAVSGEYDKINAPFVSNHDMGRVAGFYLDETGVKAKMSGAAYLLLPGTAFIYYGEEIGMRGSGEDENKRAPMYWSEDTKAGKNKVSPKSDYPPVSSQLSDESSIYQFYREAIRIRNNYPVLKCGDITLIEDMSDDDIVSLERTDKEGRYESVITVYNFSDEEKSVKITDSRYNRLGGVLYTGDTEGSLKDNTLSLPPCSVIILRGEE